MTEYIALAFIIAVLMFFLVDFGMRLEPRTTKKNDPTNKFKLVFIIGAFLLGIPLSFLGLSIAQDNGASASTINIMNSVITGYTAIAIISCFALLIYFLWWIPRVYRAAIFDKDDDEDFEE